MTFNENKYGVVSNMQHAWFFQCIETADLNEKTLQYYGPIDIDLNSAGSPGMLKAFVGIILLAELVSTWFHSSPTSAKVPPGRCFGTSLTATYAAITQAESYQSTIVAGTYSVL